MRVNTNEHNLESDDVNYPVAYRIMIARKWGYQQKDSNCATILTGPATGPASCGTAVNEKTSTLAAGVHEAGYMRNLSGFVYPALFYCIAGVHETGYMRNSSSTVPRLLRRRGRGPVPQFEFFCGVPGSGFSIVLYQSIRVGALSCFGGKKGGL